MENTKKIYKPTTLLGMSLLASSWIVIAGIIESFTEKIFIQYRVPFAVSILIILFSIYCLISKRHLYYKFALFFVIILWMLLFAAIIQHVMRQLSG